MSAKSNSSKFDIQTKEITADHAKIKVEFANIEKSTRSAVVICPGWGETNSTLRPLLKAIAEQGHSVICFQHPRKFQKVLSDTEFHHAQVQKVANISSVINHFKLDRVNLVAHSEGAINATIFCMKDPQKVSNMILIGPGGIHMHKTITRLLKNVYTKVYVDFRRTLKSTYHKSSFKNHTRNATGYFWANPKYAYLEARSNTVTDIKSILLSLVDLGVRISVIALEKDMIFPANELREELSDIKLHKFIVVDDYHDGLHYDPTTYSQQITDIIG